MALPPAESLEREALTDDLVSGRDAGSARELAWLYRCETGHEIDLARLRIDDLDVLHMPGELFVEYQLAARRMAPDRTVAVAAYGDGGPGYIGTRAAYPKGGYEVGASNVAPGVEDALVPAMRTLLDAPDSTVEPSDITAEKPRLDR